jgi:hypothetical protein
MREIIVNKIHFAATALIGPADHFRTWCRGIAQTVFGNAEQIGLCERSRGMARDVQVAHRRCSGARLRCCPMSLRRSHTVSMAAVLALNFLAPVIQAANPGAARGLIAEVLAEPPVLLLQVGEERRVLAGRLQAQVESGLASARKLLPHNPAQVEQELKLILENIDRAPDLNAELRHQLRQQVASAIREARRDKVTADQRTADAQSNRAAAQELERLSERMDNQQQQIKQLVDRFNSLLDERRYKPAGEQITPEIQRIAPGSPIASSVVESGQLQATAHQNDETCQDRRDRYLKTLTSIESSAAPFPDQLPIVYPPAQQWQDITLQREKYQAANLQEESGAEQRILSELNKNTSVDVVEMPLKDVMLYLSEMHNIPIVLSRKKLEEASISPDVPVTKTLRGITLRSALRLILKDLELSYMVQDEVIQISTPEDAAAQLTHKVYPVGDLVVPIRLPTNIFGLGGVGGMSGGPGMGNPLGNGMPGGGNAAIPGMNGPGMGMPGAGPGMGVNIF